MNKPLAVLRRNRPNRLLKSPSILICIAALTAAFFLSACAGNMSLKEARQVAVSMDEATFVPPPRKIDDITTAFDQYQIDPEATRQLMARAAADPPAGASKAKLRQFYYERGRAAQKLGYMEQSLADFRSARSFMDKYPANKNIYKRTFLELALAEYAFYNINNCLEILEEYPRKFPKSPAGDFVRTMIYVHLGDLEKAKQARKQTLSRMSSNWKPDNPWRMHREAVLKAVILDTQGRYREAEAYHRRALRYSMDPEIKSSSADTTNWTREDLATNLMLQDRLMEAEIEARQMLIGTMDFHGKQSYRTLLRTFVLCDILVKQERHQDAEKLLIAINKTLDALKVDDKSLIRCRTKQALGEALAAQGRWQEALACLNANRQNLEMNPAFSKRYLASQTALSLALLKTGQSEKALTLLAESHDVFRQDFGPDHLRTREITGLMAVACANLNRQRESLEYFSGAVPVLLGSGTKNRQQLKLILEGYLGLLDQIRGSSMAREFGIDTFHESFRIANAAHLKSVHRAIAESAARLAMKDSELAKITREEQDANLQIDNLETTLARHLSAPVQQQSPAVIRDLRQRIADLRLASQVLHQRIKTQFPQYAGMLYPKPLATEEVRQYLRPGEVYLSIYAAEEQAYIWAVPASGATGYAVAPLGQEEIRRQVARLRQALAPSPRVLGDIPEFDLGTAYGLYAELLKPVESTLKGARDLLIVAPGPLGPLPFSVLPTRPINPGDTPGIMFADYRQVPWLIRSVSITRLPGAASFIALRKLPEADTDRKMFAGFGDPVFNPAQLDASPVDNADSAAMVARGGVTVRVRGIRDTSQGNLDTSNLVSGRLSQLNRLPDTADEINSIARILEADAETDVFLGANASEGRIKTMDLSDRRVIVFASHALVPGDLDGLDQPALALSAPSVTGDQEDGILTMTEILRLKLNADWVVLSACNTGAAQGAGAEAVSGLGRAFFYAGTKAILVSMWPVETTSARKLTTRVFYNQKLDPTLSRSRALQMAAVDLMDNESIIEASTGKKIASYAHPLFWAPFIIVGEGGQSRDLE
jgi:CHAT domain-containing protein